VTGKFDSSGPAIRRERETITLRAGWLDEWCAKTNWLYYSLSSPFAGAPSQIY